MLVVPVVPVTGTDVKEQIHWSGSSEHLAQKLCTPEGIIVWNNLTIGYILIIFVFRRGTLEVKV